MSKKNTAELDAANAKIEELKAANCELLDQVDDAEGYGGMRDQLDTLATDTDSVSAPKTPEQWRRCLQGILRGEDWRNGAWK